MKNIPGLFIQGCSFQDLEQGSEWSKAGLEILKQYGGKLVSGRLVIGDWWSGRKKCLSVPTQGIDKRHRLLHSKDMEQKMNFARKIIDSDRLIDIIDLPEELKETEVEIIVLPAQIKHPDKKRHKKNFVDELIDNPIKIENFKPFSRKEIYER